MDDLTPETKDALSHVASAMLAIGQQMAILTGSLGSLNAAFERLLKETGIEELDITDDNLRDHTERQREATLCVEPLPGVPGTAMRPFACGRIIPPGGTCPNAGFHAGA